MTLLLVLVLALCAEVLVTTREFRSNVAFVGVNNPAVDNKQGVGLIMSTTDDGKAWRRDTPKSNRTSQKTICLVVMIYIWRWIYMYCICTSLADSHTHTLSLFAKEDALMLCQYWQARRFVARVVAFYI